MSTKTKLWFTGILLAVAGVVIARIIARQVATTEVQLVLYIVGTLIALGGLGVILCSFRR
jgi:hypothetical protein